MSLLVIGRTGQVATALVERAQARGVELTAVGRPDVDLAKPRSLQRALEGRPSAVINAAAYTAVDAAESDDTGAFALNAHGVGELATAAAREGVPLIHLSTDYVFAGALDRPYREDDPVDPQNAYGRSKAAGEAAVREAAGRALTLRTAWVYAPFGANFVRTMLRLGAERDALQVVDDQRGNPTSALDLADAILTLCADPARWPDGPDTLHVAGRGETTWCGLAREIFTHVPDPPSVEAVGTEAFPKPARRPANSRLDCTKLATLYGIELPRWQDSVATVVRRLAGG